MNIVPRQKRTDTRTILKIGGAKTRFCQTTSITISHPFAQRATVGKKCLCFFRVKNRVQTGV